MKSQQIQEQLSGTIPIAGRVLVKLEPALQTAKTALLLEDVKPEACQVGSVVAIGSGRIGKTGKRVPMEVKVGDRVFMKKFAGVEVRLDKQDCLMVFYDEIEGIADAN